MRHRLSQTQGTIVPGSRGPSAACRRAESRIPETLLPFNSARRSREIGGNPLRRRAASRSSRNSRASQLSTTGPHCIPDRSSSRSSRLEIDFIVSLPRLAQQSFRKLRRPHRIRRAHAGRVRCVPVRHDFEQPRCTAYRLLASDSRLVPQLTRGHEFDHRDLRFRLPYAGLREWRKPFGLRPA